MSKKLKFPEGFLWGAATSAHQVEGGLYNNWTEWENKNAERSAKNAKNYYRKWQQEKFPEMFDPQNYISGQAADHYNRYEEDFDIAQSLNHNSHRLSLAWSRIEPEEGKFNEKELDHYVQVIRALRARGMEPFVTLWHWTHPVWFEEKGGWENKDNTVYFLRYVEKVIDTIGDQVEYWQIFNEPNTFVGLGYIENTRPPQRHSFLKAWRAIKNFVSAHKQTYTLLHRLQPHAKVGISHFLVYMRPYRNNFMDKLAIVFLKPIRNKQFFKKYDGFFDFIGLQYYRVEYIHTSLTKGIWGPFTRIIKEDVWHSDIGWNIAPEGIYENLKHIYATYHKPIYISESGIADKYDVHREKFIKEELYWVHKAISDGVDVRGYHYWSLIDNFEWHDGYWPRFGLVEVDFKTQKRTIRPSAYEYAKICKSNTLEI